ncbi:hypothetical protein QCA50_013667 [Cerrena zonata]|uniref:Uncharacterized protein n=1 Tax=Cerrena zonata TaxID=2478898 RepID=A0AAW0FWE0_9APHY
MVKVSTELADKNIPDAWRYLYQRVRLCRTVRVSPYRKLSTCLGRASFKLSVGLSQRSIAGYTRLVGNMTNLNYELNDTLSEDKIDLRGMLIWTPIDNFEWSLATQQKFGLQHVNHSTPGLDRTYKLSFFQVRDFFKQHLVG